MYAYIINESPIRIWGLSSRERLKRMLKKTGFIDFVETITSLPSQNSLLIIRGDYIYDERVIKGLVSTDNVLLFVDSDKGRIPVAGNISYDNALQAFEILNGTSSRNSIPGVKNETPETISTSYVQRLRKSDTPFVLPVNLATLPDLEQRLFSWSYKGVTDLVTKWAWPRPAKWVTKICANTGVMPNQVTFAGFILVILASVLFAHGMYGLGLLAGWFMTFLDTVDGKLARVTITSSWFGHLFDHIIDLLHPPVWYVVWGMGLCMTHIGSFPLTTIYWAIIIGYATGRLTELAFTQTLGSFGIFCWHPVDSYFRLITARRNPNLIMLTAGALTGHPDLGLLAVAAWTILTSLFLLIRLVMAVFTRITSGPLHSWLQDVDQGIYDESMAVRIFTNRNAGI